jgi:PilZ domain
MANAELEELGSGLRIYGRVSQISEGGCNFETDRLLRVGTHVFIKVFTRRDFFEAFACVMHSTARVGIGLRFDGVEKHFQPTLQRWLAERIQPTPVLTR